MFILMFAPPLMTVRLIMGMAVMAMDMTVV